MSQIKEKLAKTFKTDPNKARTSNQTLLQNNAQISLLYQLEQRKNHKLEEENRSLQERIRALTTDTDEARIRLLVADKTKRKLVQLKAITNRTIASLESGLKAFSEFVADIDRAVVEQTKQGAVPSLQVCTNPKPELLNPKFEPKLSRIAESPLIVSCQLSNILQETINLTCEPAVHEVLEDVPVPLLQISKENEGGGVRRMSTNTNRESPTRSEHTLEEKVVGIHEEKNERKTTKTGKNLVDKKLSESLRRSMRKTLILEEELSSPIQFHPSVNYECKPGRESSFFGGQALTPVYTSTPKPEKVGSASRSKSTNYLRLAKENQIKENYKISAEECLPQNPSIVTIEPCKRISSLVAQSTFFNHADGQASAHKNITERCRRTINNDSQSSEDNSTSIQSYSDSVLSTPVVESRSTRRATALRRRKSIFVKAAHENDRVVDYSNPSFKSVNSQPSVSTVRSTTKRKKASTLSTPDQDQTITLLGSVFKKRSKNLVASTDCTVEVSQMDQKTFAVSQSSSTCNMSEQQTGRQKRTAVSKVASYKMPSLNTKMRRAK